MKLIKVNQKDIHGYIELGLLEAPCVLYGIYDTNFAWLCKQKQYNKEYLIENNIDFIELDGDGSAIICSPGDIDFGFFGSEDFCYEQFNKISNLVSQLVSNGRILNNDFMYGDYKLGSGTKIQFGDITYIGVHISNEINMELINNVCNKKMYKIPNKMPVKVTEEDVLKLFGGDNNGYGS